MSAGSFTRRSKKAQGSAVVEGNPSQNIRPLPKSHPDFGVRAGFLVHDVSRLRRSFFDEAMKPYGLTRSQWWVLGQLSRHNRPMSQAELARHLDIGKAALGGLIDRLEIVGYVKRMGLLGDRRINSIAVTKKGEEMTSTLRRVGHSLNEIIFSGLTMDEVHALEKTLTRVKGNLVKLVFSEQADEKNRAELKRDKAGERPSTSFSEFRSRRALAKTRKA